MEGLARGAGFSLLSGSNACTGTTSLFFVRKCILTEASFRRSTSKQKSRTDVRLRCKHCIARRRRDSNPRNVAVQQFSRLPPSTTRPHLQRDCKDRYFPWLSKNNCLFKSCTCFVEYGTAIVDEVAPAVKVASLVFQGQFQGFLVE